MNASTKISFLKTTGCSLNCIKKILKKQKTVFSYFKHYNAVLKKIVVTTKIFTIPVVYSNYRFCLF